MKLFHKRLLILPLIPFVLCGMLACAIWWEFHSGWLVADKWFMNTFKDED